MVSKYADASSIMGETVVDSAAIDDLARGEYRRAVGEKMPRDYVQMYHPDGSTSIVQLPPLGKNGKNLGDRQRKLMHYILNKKAPVKQRDGTWKTQQWWYPAPPAGWKPAETPWRCPVQECTRAGGLKDLLNLWRHIKSKHPGEVELYDGVLKAIKARLSEASAVNLETLFTGGDIDRALVSDEELAAVKFEDAANLLDEQLPQSGVPAATFEPEVAETMCDCGWKTTKGEQSMATHRKRWCPLLKVEG